MDTASWNLIGSTSSGYVSRKHKTAGIKDVDGFDAIGTEDIGDNFKQAVTPIQRVRQYLRKAVKISRRTSHCLPRWSSFNASLGVGTAHSGTYPDDFAKYILIVITTPVSRLQGEANIYTWPIVGR